MLYYAQTCLVLQPQLQQSEIKLLPHHLNQKFSRYEVSIHFLRNCYAIYSL